MKRVILAIAGAMLSVATNAASPPTSGAPVTVQNTPLPTTVTNTPLPVTVGNTAPLPVNIVQNPGNAQQSPVGVFIVNSMMVNPNEVSAATTLGNVNCEVTVADEDAECLDQYGPRQLASPFVVRMVSFLPLPFSTYPTLDFQGLRCQANAFVSLDNGATAIRLASAAWTPGNANSVHVQLPAGVFLPIGSSLRGRVRLFAENGPAEQGCRVGVVFWSTTR